MIAAIVREIQLTPTIASTTVGSYDKPACETVYFGGGTPSILSTADLLAITGALHEKFSIGEDAEITLEANPDDINPAQLQEWKTLGINRLSIGIQSFVQEELRWMNRAHTAADSLRCIDQVKEAGFSNYSIDLIYGSPLLSNEDWKRNVMTVLDKNIPHISCYGLTVEPKTALDKMIALKQKAPVDPEKQANQFLSLMDWMQAGGYEHYEISNFAQPGMRSRHNSSYWKGAHYYGFGPSAHCYDGKSRKWNIANNALYIKSIQQDTLPFEEEVLTPIQQLNEYIMTSLRTVEGLDLLYVERAFGEVHAKQIIIAAKKHLNNGKLFQKNASFILSKEGKLFADGIAADLFF